MEFSVCNNRPDSRSSTKYGPEYEIVVPARRRNTAPDDGRWWRNNRASRSWAYRNTTRSTVDRPSGNRASLQTSAILHIKKIKTYSYATKRNAKPSAVTNEQTRSRGGVRFPIIFETRVNKLPTGYDAIHAGTVEYDRAVIKTTLLTAVTSVPTATSHTDWRSDQKYVGTYSYMVRTFQDCQKRIAVSGAAFADENEKVLLDTFGANRNGRAVDFTFSFLIALIDTVLEIT